MTKKQYQDLDLENIRLKAEVIKLKKLLKAANYRADTPDFYKNLDIRMECLR